MFRLIVFLSVNRHNLNQRFLFAALYRKYLRTRSKLFTFDGQDKLFFLLFCTHILVGIFLLGQLEKPSLRFLECQFLYPLLGAYLYVSTKKFFRSTYFHHFIFFSVFNIFVYESPQFKSAIFIYGVVS
jgi:hypothetical protein